MAAGDRDMPDESVRKKVLLLKIGLYGFISSLVITVFSLFSMGAVSLLGLLWTDGGIIGAIGNIIGSVIPLFFAAPFLFFAILIASLLMKPREADMALFMKPSISAIAVIIVAGVVLCAVPILVAFITVMAALYLRGSGILFFALAYFAAACLIFFLSGGYAMIREIAAAKGLGTGIGWVGRVFRVLRVGSSDAGPELDGQSLRTLTRIERITGSIMGVAMFLLFQMRRIYESAQGVTDKGSGSAWLDVIATKETVLWLFSMVVFIFATLFIIKSVKMVFNVKGGGTAGT